MTDSLGLTRVAFGCQAIGDLALRQAAFTWGEGAGRHVLITSARTPRRDLTGGSLFWILKHTLVARQAILRIEELPGAERTLAGIHLAPDIVLVQPRHCRAHQGWRYISGVDWPADEREDEALPPALAAELAGLALI
ncbi:MAG: DUF1489 family protein [Sandaracinobacteroides sp.]